MRDKKFAVILVVLMLLSVGLKAQTKHRYVRSAHTRLAIQIANGQKVFLNNCATCHQADGGGVQNMNPPLVQTTYVLGDKVKLIKIVLNGFNEDVDINDQRYSNNMPSHDFLKDQEIADVLTYIRHSFTNKASAVSVAQVRFVRATNKPPTAQP